MNRIQTRSKTSSVMKIVQEQPPHDESVISHELPVEIDFDEASRAWNQNKRRIGASYYYLCGHILANGKDTCKNPAKKDKEAGTTRYCNVHS